MKVNGRLPSGIPATASGRSSCGFPTAPVLLHHVADLRPVATYVRGARPARAEVAQREIAALEGAIGAAERAVPEIGETVRDVADFSRRVPDLEPQAEDPQAVQLVVHRDGEEARVRTQVDVTPAGRVEAEPCLCTLRAEWVMRCFLYSHVNQLRLARHRQRFWEIVPEP